MGATKVLWGDRNLSFYDGNLPIARIAATEELESVSLTFLPGADDVAAFDDQVLSAHPNCAVRIYRLPAGTDLAVLGGLTRIRRLKLEVEARSLEFLASLRELVRFHGMLRRGANTTAIPWPRGLRHLSLVAHSLAALDGLPALRSLELAAAVGDLGFVEGIPKLASLALDGRSTGDLSALARCASLAHVRVNGQAKVEAAHLASLAQVETLRFVQLMYLPRIADVGWLGDRPRHLELTAMKGLRQIAWPGLARAESVALYPPFGKVREIDVTALLAAKSLKRAFLSPLLSKAVGGKAVVEALKPLHNDIQTFRAAIHAELGLESA
jgi:hypothetical protein